eukprot:g13524.t1
MPPREDPSVGHRKVQVGVADLYEAKDTKNRYWPVTLTEERVDKKGTFEVTLFDDNLNPLGTREVDAKFLRAYNGDDYDVPDRVMLSDQGVASVPSHGPHLGHKMQPTETGTIIGKGQSGFWSVRSDETGQTGQYAEFELKHVSRNYDKMVGPRTFLQLDSEYIWVRGLPRSKATSTPEDPVLGLFGSYPFDFLDGSDDTHEGIPVVLVGIDEQKGTVKLEAYNYKEKDMAI